MCFGLKSERDADNLECLIVTGQAEERRPRGWNRIQWLDQIFKDLEIPINIASDRKTYVADQRESRSSAVTETTKKKKTF